jgi:glycerol-3-phosphate acyltransferase PlsY
MTPIETPILILILWAIVGYTMGSVPFGIVLSRLMGLGDLRKLGSGNIGATNVLRTGNKTAAALTVVLDAGKGTAAVLLASAMSGEDAAQLAGLAALIGHCFTIFLKFKGGKGTATFLGVMLGLSFPLGLACCASWLATAYFLRISSLSALVAAASSLLWALIFGQAQMVGLCAVLALLVFERHRANIFRLKAGIEPKIGQK